MTKKHEKHEKHEKKKKSGKQYHSNIESSDSEKPEAKMRKTNKLDERDNDQTAFQEQVEELSWLIQKIMKGKQKAANPKDMIIDWSEVELRFSRKEPICIPITEKEPNEIAGIMDQLLEDKALNTKKTFDSQRKLVQNNIIPKWERQNKTIDKLKKLKDRLINKFHTNELQSLQTDNRYHSPELRFFLRNYVDNVASNARRVRKWVYDTEYASNEDSAPLMSQMGKKDDNKIQEDDNKSQEDDDKSHKSQEDDDATGGEKNEDQEKKQDEEVDDRKLKKEKEKCKSCFGRIR
ncbi:hypothetical protein RhiirA1_402792 [Rhizophagus irregularis]|uniref:Uncharacterized protein n=1 Tax=Rhizophagus irregularis TaxID=588596 RepID=A0A2N0QWX5_9GLOM|nr:hypothetical protein RhiirA1_402792 [Rhizophagus irregularis]